MKNYTPGFVVRHYPNVSAVLTSKQVKDKTLQYSTRLCKPIGAVADWRNIFSIG